MSDPEHPAATRDGEPDDGAASRRNGGSRRHRSGAWAAVKETVVVVGTALALSLLIKTFLVQAFYIPSPSMERTLVDGDRVLTSLLTPGPFDLARGDIVVFEDPGGWLPSAQAPDRGPVAGAVVGVLTFVGVLPRNSGDHLIKRVIGMPGDTVACCDDAGRLSVNGSPIEEPYVSPGDEPSQITFEVVVPDDRLWVMGDHRSVSQDSRWHQDLEGRGTVPVDDVVGRAMAVIWPLDRLDWLSDYPDVFADVPPAADGAGAQP